jgi:diguanylate cyclase (GGDEF)-like protein/PAS domain S-box-containing protein
MAMPVGDLRTWPRTSHEHETWLLQSVKDCAIFMLDRAGHVLTWNPGAELVHGYRAEAVVGRHVSCFYPDDDVQAGIPARNLAQAAEEGRCEDEGWRVRSDGSRFRAQVVLTALHDQVGRVRGYAAVTQDVSERHRLLEQLEHRVLRDPATGLPNRVLFMERLGQALTRLERRPNALAVLCLALDRFQVVTDRTTRPVGDEILTAVAARVAGELREEDTVARLEGEELVILCEQVTDAHHARAVAERVVRGAGSPFLVDGGEVVVTARAGIAMANSPAPTAERLVLDARAAARSQPRPRPTSTPLTDSDEVPSREQ